MQHFFRRQQFAPVSQLDKRKTPKQARSMIPPSSFKTLKCLKCILGVVSLFSLCPWVHGIEPITAALIGSAITAGVTLTGTSVSVLSQMGPNRNIVIEITNHLDHPLIGGTHFLQWGFNRSPPPSVIGKLSREAVQFEKVGHTATGTSGLMSYTVDDDTDPISLAIIWSVPYNYIHAANWFGLTFVDIGTPMDLKLYNELYYDPGWKNPDARTDRKFGYAYQGNPITMFKGNYIVSASMSNLGRSILKVDIMKKDGGHAKHHHKFTGFRD